MSLNDRRAEFIYNAARLAAIAAQAPIIPVEWKDRELSFRKQFLGVVARQCSSDRKTNPEELHNDWVAAYMKMGWVYAPVYNREKKHHPDMRPYNALGNLERDKDAVFMALCEIAREWIY